MFLGQFDESIEQVKQSQELDPLSLIINANMGLMRYFARRFDNAIGYCRRALEMDPNFSETHWYLVMVYCPKGLYDDATRKLQRAVSPSGDFPKHKGSHGYAYVLAGKKDDAIEILNDIKSRGENRYYPAIVYGALGEKDRAFVCLEKCYRERSDNILYLRVDPTLEILHPDPRFKAFSKI